MKKALITGITGQAGSILADLLLEKGYIVHGIIRRSSSFNTKRIDHIFDKLNIHYGDMTDLSSLINIIKECNPDVIYNAAAMSHVKVSFENPIYCSQVDAIGTLNLLESVRLINKNIKIFHFSTSELYGDVLETPQNENTPFNPQSPYAISKLYSYWICKNYIKNYGMYITQGIMFNYEGVSRGDTFVTKKIINYVLKGDYNIPLQLGNINAKRDWGYATEYMKIAIDLMELPNPDIYVISTGETHTVKEFCDEAFKHAGIIINWKGEEIDEKGYDQTGKLLIEINEKYFRPSEVNLLLGDCSKLEKTLGYKPKTKFKKLVEIMYNN